MDQSRIWYVVVQSKAEGPFTLEEMKARVKKGEMGPIDYVFKPGLKNWMKAEEFSEFFDDGAAAVLSKVTEPPKMSADTAKIVMTPDEIPHAAPKATPNEIVSAPLALAAASAHIESKVQTSLPTQVVSHAAPVVAAPVIAASPNVVAPTPPTPVPKAVSVEEVTKSVTLTNINPSESADLPPLTTNKWSHQKLRYAVAGAAAILAMGILWTAFHSSEKPNQTAAVNIQPSAPVAQAPVVAQPPALVPAQPAPVAVAQPKTFKIIPLKMATQNPQLAFEGNFTADKTVQVEVSAEPGQILKYLSFHFRKEIQVNPGTVPTLDLTSLNLPAGRYTVIAKKGSETTQANVDVGVQNAQFKQQLAAFQKTVREKRQKEKRFLASCSKELNSQMKGLNAIYKGKQGAAWTKAYANWKRDMKQMLTRLPDLKNKNNFVHIELFQKATVLHKELAVLGTEVNGRAKMSGNKRQVASGVTQKTAEHAAQFKQMLKEFDKDVKTIK